MHFFIIFFLFVLRIKKKEKKMSDPLCDAAFIGGKIYIGRELICDLTTQVNSHEIVRIIKERFGPDTDSLFNVVLYCKDWYDKFSRRTILCARRCLNVSDKSISMDISPFMTIQELKAYVKANPRTAYAMCLACKREIDNHVTALLELLLQD